MSFKSIHAGSFVLGSIALGGLLFLASSRAVGGLDLRPLIVQVAPHPRDHVRLVEGTPYQVPARRFLTLKSFTADGSTTDTTGAFRVEVDGKGIATLYRYSLETGVLEIPFGITVGPGSTVDLVEINPKQASAPVVVYGYLSDA